MTEIGMDASVANVSRFLDAMAFRQGETPALKVPKGRDVDGRIDYLTLSFRELSGEQDAWGFYLKERGICRGARVLLMVRPGLPLIALSFALFKIGAVPVVIDPGMGLKSFLSCVRRTQPDAMVGIGMAIWVARVFRGTFRSVGIRVRVGGPLSRAPKSATRESLEAADTEPEDLAAILFTSGSTGAPKGVCYEHGMFEAQVAAIREEYGIEPGEIDLPMLPIFALFNPALGMTTVVPEINPSQPAKVDPAKIVQAIEQCGVTNSFGSPVLWKKIGAYCEARQKRLPSLKRILMAGASAPPDLMRQFQDILGDGQTFSPYGATEVLPVASIADREVLGDAAERTAQGFGTCVGRSLRGVDVRILAISDEPLESAALDSPLKLGEIGEIVVTGPSVTKEYDQLPDATRRAKISAEGRIWHRMGDVGYFDDAGYLWFCGRQAERVDTGRKIYYSDCCEGVFNRLPEVFRTALIGWRSGGTVYPAVVVEPVAGAFPKTEADRACYIEALKKIGAESEATRSIDRFFFEKAFPVDVRHNAKIHRYTLAKRFSSR